MLKYIAFGALFIFMSSTTKPGFSADRKWVSIGGSSDVDLYINPLTIRRNGQKVKAWTMFDYKTPQTAGSITYLSHEIYDEYDCQTEQSRGDYAVLYSSNMANGNTVFSTKGSGEWFPIVPGSLAGSAMKFACKNP